MQFPLSFPRPEGGPLGKAGIYEIKPADMEDRRMKYLIIAIVVVLSLTQPCLAEYKGLQKAADEVAGNSSYDTRSCGDPQRAEIYRNTDILADFWVKGGGRMIVQLAKGGKGTIKGKSAQQWGDFITPLVRNRLGADLPDRNIDIVSGSQRDKDYVLTLYFSAISGIDVIEDESEHSENHSYRRSGGATSSRDRNREERLGLSLSIGLSLEQVQGDGYRTISLPEPMLSVEESQLVGLTEESSDSRSYTYRSHGRGSSVASTSREKHSLKRDKVKAEAQMMGPQAMRLSGLVAAPVFDGIATDIQKQKYRSDRDRKE